MRSTFRIILLLLLAASAFAQNAPILLWPNGAPGSEGKTTDETVRVTENGEHIVSSVHRPSIIPFLPSKENATGAAVVIAPGGGHRELWMDHEGYNVARWLSQHGVAAFVLKYRLARETGSTYTIEGTELADIQRAVRLVRSRASEWGVNPERIGVMGFSAGGELAAMASTRYEAGVAGAVDPIEGGSSKPAFQALLYPAIPNKYEPVETNPARISRLRRRRSARYRGGSSATISFPQTGRRVGGAACSCTYWTRLRSSGRQPTSCF
ncbi:MAG: alpha/beta hydrolase [Candidatus Sulfotelmatobacter sp.]